MTGSMLWKANSVLSDWRNGEPLTRVLERALALDLIGDVSWIKSYDDRERQPFALAGDADLPARLLSKFGNDACHFQVGGEQPPFWRLAWNTGNFDLARVDGLNVLSLIFDRTALADPARADDVLAAFLELNRPEDTDYAALHPYEHWFSFADAHYRPPITIAPLFKGVFAANFLGPDQLAEFDRDQLAGLVAPTIQWSDSRGLAFTATTDLATADSPTTESEMLRLTAFFRGALRRDSVYRRV